MKPRLRLFLSADIVGSTALKHSPPGDTRGSQRTAWSNLIQSFYFEAEQHFLREFRTIAGRSPKGEFVGPSPLVWKTVGDEILFQKEVTNSRQAFRTLTAWMHALECVRDWLKVKDKRLDIKSACWTAGFPCKNAEVVVDIGRQSINPSTSEYFIEAGEILNRIYSGEDVPGIAVDFIGPSIDIGFRLAKYASTRRMIVCVDTAYMLAHHPSKKGGNRTSEIYYDGSETLKGVNGGAGYPIFWIDLSPGTSIERSEDRLTKRQSIPSEDIIGYCDDFYRENSGFTHPPFIDYEGEEDLRDRPDHYNDMIAELAKNFEPEPTDEAASGVDPESGVSIASPSVEI